MISIYTLQLKNNYLFYRYKERQNQTDAFSVENKFT